MGIGIGIGSNSSWYKAKGGGLTFNTIIGGEGINTTTAGALETKLGLSGGDVQDFTLDGNDIKCNIGVSYVIPSLAFNNNTDITSFIDTDGLADFSASATDQFRFATNLTTVQLEGVTIFKNSGDHFWGSGVTGTLSFPNITTLTEPNLNTFRECPDLVGLEFPNLTSSSGDTCLIVYNTGSLSTFYAPKLATIGSNTGYTQFFRNITIGATITVSDVLRTNNGGGRDGDISYAEDTRGCTIVYVV